MCVRTWHVSVLWCHCPYHYHKGPWPICDPDLSYCQETHTFHIMLSLPDQDTAHPQHQNAPFQGSHQQEALTGSPEWFPPQSQRKGRRQGPCSGPRSCQLGATGSLKGSSVRPVCVCARVCMSGVCACMHVSGAYVCVNLVSVCKMCMFDVHKCMRVYMCMSNV